MSLGNKILELRKKEKFSQEQLAEKLNVTRQTISNWELNITNPDIEQAKELSKLFNISLDELVDNDIKDVLIEKTSNTEKLAGMVIKILKIIGIGLIITLVIDIISFVLFTFARKEPSTSKVKNARLSCSIKNDNYLITIGDNSYFNCSNCDKKMQVYLRDITDWANIDTSIQNINQYFQENGGACQKAE